jgi:lantibiotic biosynthesis protein
VTILNITPAAEVLAARLHSPDPSADPRLRQSLADGAAGIALLHIERAYTGHGTWRIVHTWLRAATGTDIAATGDACLYFGAPALGFVLHAADQAGRYSGPRDAIDRAVTVLAHRRVDQALARIRRAELPAAAEYDVIRGLTGIGAHLLRHTPSNDVLGRILDYLVRLTQPVDHDGIRLPGWWTRHDPSGRASAAFPGGHGNLGMAHGVTGPLALLALARRAGVVVDGHAAAIDRICAWLDNCRRGHDGAWWWPQWITLDEQHTGHARQAGPMRPSWCYGTPGIARAQQLAGLATGDPARRHLAEQALAACLNDPAQLDSIRDASLCHGWAGLLHTVRACAADADATLDFAGHMAGLTDRLAQHVHDDPAAPHGFLEGAAGAALTLHAGTSPTASGWDACLLIT